MPNRASRTKGWCKPMATVVISIPKERISPPVKNLCERSCLQRRQQLHSRSQEQILHLILAKRPRRYNRPLFEGLQVVRYYTISYRPSPYYIDSQFIFKREQVENWHFCHSTRQSQQSQALRTIIGTSQPRKHSFSDDACCWKHNRCMDQSAQIHQEKLKDIENDCRIHQLSFTMLIRKISEVEVDDSYRLISLDLRRHRLSIAESLSSLFYEVYLVCPISKSCD